jgi:nitrate reductase gamma subunit
MNRLYAILTGPALWVAFIIFCGGMLLRIAYLYGLSRERDRVFYNHISWGWGIRSIIQWMIPMGSAAMRLQPVFTVLVFAFHIPLLLVPIFLDAHNIMLEEAFGFRLWSLPDPLADTLSILVVLAGVGLLIRRIVRPEVRLLTTGWDYTLLVLTLLPFVTGVMAFHHWGPYETMMIAHILSSELLLVLIPVTKLGHMVLFFFTRAFIGFEMGGRRGAVSW